MCRTAIPRYLRYKVGARMRSSKDGAVTVSNVSSLRWLHITDLHIGKDDESQGTALASLVAAIHQYANEKPFDCVFITGDLAYSGQQEQYVALEKLLISPLRASDLFRHSRFFCTPGNHDLDCDIGLPIIWKDLGPR